MEGWEAFFTAQVGASAALTGLIFVSVSISLQKILKYSKLVNRAFQVLTVLLPGCLLADSGAQAVLGTFRQ